MHWRLTALGIILCLTVVARDLARQERWRSPLPHFGTRLQMPLDPESLLASGQRLPLPCVSAVDLELIPGITERLASRLVAFAASLSAYAKTHGAAAALQEIKGIGPRTGDTLSRLVTFEGSCEQAPEKEQPGAIRHQHQGP